MPRLLKNTAGWTRRDVGEVSRRWGEACRWATGFAGGMGGFFPLGTTWVARRVPRGRPAVVLPCSPGPASWGRLHVPGARARLLCARAGGGGCHGDRQVSGKRCSWSLPYPRRAKEDAVVKATWVGGEETGGRRKDGRPWRRHREVTEVSPAPCILHPPSPANHHHFFFFFLSCLLPAETATAAPEPLAMAEPGRSRCPSARGRGKIERRTLGLVRLLLWAGIAFHVAQGTEPELHACKEVLSTCRPDPVPVRDLGSSRRPG